MTPGIHHGSILYSKYSYELENITKTHTSKENTERIQTIPLLLHSFVFLAIRRMRRAPCTKALMNRNNHRFRRTGSENQDTLSDGDTPQFLPSLIWARRRTTSQEMARSPTFEPQVITEATTIRSMQHTAVTTNAVATDHHHQTKIFDKE